MPIAINGSGTVTGISVGGLPDGIVDADMLAANAVTAGKLASGVGGKILQVKHTTKTSFFSTSTTGGTDVTGVSVTITPSSSSSKILVSCFGEYGNGNNDSFASLFLARTIGSGSVNGDIAIGDSRGSTTRATMNATLRSGGGLSHNVSRSFGCQFLDSPNTTNAVIYKLGINVIQGAPACIGGTSSDGYANFASVPTYITAMEVAA